MRDMQVHQEKPQTQIAECEMIRDLATDRAKQEMFAKLAEHFKVLAGELQREIAKRIADGVVLNHQTQEPFSTKED
jgi:hypothetical protein